MVALSININELVAEAFKGFAESGIHTMQEGVSPNSRMNALKEAARNFGRQMATQNSGTFVAAKYNLNKEQRATLLEEQSLPHEFVDHLGLANKDRVGQILAFVHDIENMEFGTKIRLLENIFISPNLMFSKDSGEQRCYYQLFNMPARELFSNMLKAPENRDMNIRGIELFNDEFAIQPETLISREEEVLADYRDDTYSSFADVLALILSNFSSSDKAQKQHYAQMVRNMQAMAINYSVKASEHFREDSKN